MLTFEFNGVRGTMTRDAPLTSGMVGQKVRLLFSPEWEELQKIAIFRAGDVVRDVADVAEDVLIPAKVLETPLNRLYVGIYGTSATGDLVIPTVWAEGPMIEEGAVPSGDPSLDPENPVWQQILTMIGDLSKLATEARENLVSAINEVEGLCRNAGWLPLPQSAEAGQCIVVSAVDEKGAVTATEAVTLSDAEGVMF